jgi:acetyl-CoA acetyltransferase
MSRPNAARNQVAVVGYAQSPILRHAGRPVGAIAVDVAREAIADAGLDVKDVDGFTTGALLPTAGDHAVVDGVSTVSANWLAQHLGVLPRYATGFQGYGQLPGAVALAVNALVSGAADHVLVHRALHNPAGRYHGTARHEARGAEQWTMPQGYFGPLAMIALPTTEYMQRYRATRESLGAVVVEARKNGARLPWSHWYERSLDLTDYLAAPLLSDPICRFDCDLPVDGVAAFVLTTAERARDLPHRPVYVAAYASGQPARHRLPLHWPLDDVMGAGAAMAARLWERAGVGPDAVDLPQVYDGFSPFVWFWLEVLGLCPTGEAHRFVTDGGIDADIAGALPALSGGGALGNGRMHGVPQMLECYLQLARRAGERQRDVSVGVACHSSPHYGGAVVYASEPVG